MPGDCSCVRCTVAFGQQLGNIIHTWFETTTRAKNVLEDPIYDIMGSASALQHLQDLIDQDKAAAEGTTRVFTTAALQQIEALGTKCNLIFKAIILLVQKAAESKASSNDEDEGSDKEEDEQKTDYKSDLLIGPIPDLTSIKTLGLVGRFNRSTWDWLEVRVTHCQAQLRWVRKCLLLQLHIAKLAQMQSSNTERENGAFESEMVARAVIWTLRQGQLRYIRTRARKQERAQRLRDLEAKREEKDNASIRSGSSRASAKTAVDENAPAVDVVKAVPPPPAMSIPPPAPLPGAPEPSPGDANVQKPTSQLATHAQVSMNSKETKGTSTLSTSLNSLGEKLSDTMTDWTHKIFGKDDEFTKDWESQELEAWVTSGISFAIPMKVPFGHRRLQYGLKQIKGKKKDEAAMTTFDRYIDKGLGVQHILDDVAREANRRQKRERVCLAFQQYPRPEGSFTIVFFSIRHEKPPISFTDCVGRKLTIPYEMCKTWDDMRDIIKEAFRHIPVVGPHVLEGHYYVLGAQGEIILNPLWSSAIKPGAAISMALWPMEQHPLRGFYGQPPYGAAPHLASAQARARQQRMMLMHAAVARGPAAPVRPPGITPPPPPGARAPVVTSRGPPPPRGPRWPWWPPGRATDEDGMTREEEGQLSFVDYAEELEKTRAVTVADLLARFTNLKDVAGGQCLGDEIDFSAASDSDSDSSSGTSSSGTHSIVDD